MHFPKSRALAVAAAASVAFLAACTQTDPAGAAGRDQDTPGATAALTSDPNVAGIGGCWNLRHGNYVGRLTLKQTGTEVAGYMDWENHADALVFGTVLANGVNMNFSYLYEKTGLTAKYNGTLQDSYLVGSNGGLQWDASPVACLDEVLSGCYLIEQGSYIGHLTLYQPSLSGTGRVTGFMDWDNHPDAVVLGTFNHADRKMTASFTYPNGTGMYEATLSADQMILNGETYAPGNPNHRTPFNGWARPCKDIAGCYSLRVRHGEASWSYGTARIESSNGYNLTGYVDWQGMGRVNLTGILPSRKIEFAQSLPGRSIDGKYFATMSHEGDTFWWGEQYRNGVKVGNFAGSRILCPAR